MTMTINRGDMMFLFKIYTTASKLKEKMKHDFFDFGFTNDLIHVVQQLYELYAVSGSLP